MPRKGGVPENLKPFKPGFDERRNLAGVPKGTQALKTIFDKFLETRTKADDGTGETLDVTKKEAIALRIIADALLNNDPDVRLKAAKIIFDTTDPAVKEFKHSGDAENPITFDFSNLSTEEKRQYLKLSEKTFGASTK